ncbi:hypothetical protein RZS08_29610, partial [Arthrospira platensis SPKY1]|nr:hypothetical protein [Arthrospira platensis SPKY1]
MNNLVTSTRTNTSGTVFVMYQGTAGNQINYNNNAYFSGSNAVFGFNGGNVQTFAAWQALGRDQNAIFASPNYINPGAGNFTPGSGAINDMGANL